MRGCALHLFSALAQRGRGTLRALDARLVRVFTTRFRRDTWLLDLSRGTKAELVLDIGTIVAGTGRARRTAPICEVEIELKSDGSGRGAAVLLKFAKRLARDLPLIPLPYSKAERGDALAEGRAIEPKKPKMPRAHPDEPATAYLARAVRACQHALLVNVRGLDRTGETDPEKGSERTTLESDHAEFVHQARVALRYMRSTMGAHSSLAGQRRTRALNKVLRSTHQVFGSARDWTVFELKTLDALETIIATDESGTTAMRLLRTAASQRRGAADLALRTYLKTTEFAQAALAVERFIVSVASRRSRQLRDTAPPMLERQHARVIGLAHTIGTLDARQRHRFRIEVKRLRYTVELFDDLFDKEAFGVYKRCLSELQDELGELNDMAVIPGLLDKIDLAGNFELISLIPLSRQRVDEWLEGHTRECLPRIAALSVKLELAVHPWLTNRPPSG